MKEKYLEPEVKLDEYEKVDILTASSDVQGDDNDVPFGS